MIIKFVWKEKNAIAEVMIVICMQMLGNVREMHDV